MAYVAFRFEPKFAVPVLIALLHDLLITAGVYSLSEREVTTSTVAALLTILGFSLYDTVIVFDRIRENAPRMPRATFSQIVNRSMAEVLTRSVATSQSTLFPVAALLLFGGETLKDFAFALRVGIASGTYSSVFIASPVLTAWKEREAVYVSRRRRIVEAFGMVPAFAVATAGSGDAGQASAPVSAGGRRSKPEPLGEPEEIGEPAELDEREPVSEDGSELDGEGELPEEALVEDEEPEDAPELVTDRSERDGARDARRRAERKKRARQRRRKHGRRR